MKFCVYFVYFSILIIIFIIQILCLNIDIDIQVKNLNQRHTHTHITTKATTKNKRKIVIKNNEIMKIKMRCLLFKNVCTKAQLQFFNYNIYNFFVKNINIFYIYSFFLYHNVVATVFMYLVFLC